MSSSSSFSVGESSDPPPPAISLHDIEEYDDAPFSESFSDWMEEVTPTIDRSYYLERITDIQNLVPEWDDEDVDEVLVMSQKGDTSFSHAKQSTVNLPTIFEVDEPFGSERSTRLSEFEPSSGTLCTQRSTGRVFVLKRMQAADAHLYTAIMNTINNLDASFLAKMRWHFTDGDSFNIIMDSGQRGMLLDLVLAEDSQVLDLTHITRFSREMVDALHSLKSAGIVHSAISPESIFLDAEGHIVVSCFENAAFQHGFNHLCNARSYHGIERSRENLLQCYTAPEVLLGWETDFSADVWGFGLTLYFLLTGQHGFGLDENVNLQNVLYGGVSLDFTISIPSSARELIIACVVKNPSQRLAIHDIEEHPYFGALDWSHGHGKKTEPPSQASTPLSSNSTRLQNLLPSVEPPERSSLGSTSSAISRLSLGDNILYSAAINSQPVDNAPQALHKTERVSRMPSPIRVAQPQTHPQAYEPPPPPPSPRTRMDLFWESLDQEIPPSPESFSQTKLRTRKSFPNLNLKSQRLSLFVSERFNKTPRRSVSQMTLKLPEPAELPCGVEQIGHGIGFTYSAPAGAISKASVCSGASKSWLSFSPRLFQSRKKSPMDREALPRVSGSCDSRQESLDLSLPCPDVYRSPAELSSPFSDGGPLTPPPSNLFTFANTEEVKALSPSSTLRLVSPSSLSLSTHPFYNLAGNGFV